MSTDATTETETPRSHHEVRADQTRHLIKADLDGLGPVERDRVITKLRADRTYARSEVQEIARDFDRLASSLENIPPRPGDDEERLAKQLTRAKAYVVELEAVLAQLQEANQGLTAAEVTP
jgi:hypothetical protein